MTFFFKKEFSLYVTMIESYEIAGPNKVTHVHELDFIKERYKGIIKDSIILCWLVRNGLSCSLESYFPHIHTDKFHSTKLNFWNNENK
jgi:hypothetical protein